MTPFRLEVITPQGAAGVLAQGDRYVFACDPKAAAAAAVSLTMPVRLSAYERTELHPVFQMNLPEGYLLERLRHLLAKTTGASPMALLALLGGGDVIGRLRFETGATRPLAADAGGERLGSILAYQGAGSIFDALLDRYLLRSTLSGVQPKVLVPEVSAAEGGEQGARPKASAYTADLIVKSGLDEFPGLAINEFVCMSAVKAAGIPVPEFYLSDNRQLFVMRRFDRTADGQALGFEDMAVLSAKGADQKYLGRYEDLVKLIGAFCSEAHVKASLAQFFDMVAISCILGNGDGHLKNFGVLYDSPDDDTVRLAPAFDIVATTCYLPMDSLALTLGGSKSLLAARLHLIEFGARCHLAPKRVPARILELCDAVDATLRTHAGLVGEVPALADAIGQGLTAFRASFGGSPRGMA
ncbi:type II toxin-antitoxin system HipA family toxin [soil metagenome]